MTYCRLDEDKNPVECSYEEFRSQKESDYKSEVTSDDWSPVQSGGLHTGGKKAREFLRELDI